MHVKEMNRAVENTIETKDEFFARQIKDKLVIFRQLHYHLFRTVQSLCGSTSYSLLMSMVYEFYFTIIHFFSEDSRVYDNFSSLGWLTSLPIILSISSKIIVGKMLNTQVERFEANILDFGYRFIDAKKVEPTVTRVYAHLSDSCIDLHKFQIHSFNQQIENLKIELSIFKVICFDANFEFEVIKGQFFVFQK